MFLPIAVVLFSFTQPFDPIWQHLGKYVLPAVLENTFTLLVLVSFGTLSLGVSLAWLTSMCQFPCKRFFTWGLMLPMAVPAYVLAFVSVGALEYTGAIQTLFRHFNVGITLPPIRNVWGAGLVLSLVFYPYVYLLARQAFLSQGRRALEAGQMLGLSRTQAFYKVALPQARPWIIGGLLIALMETLADFGAVSVFNVDTFTTAIYKTWFGFFNLTAASQLAGMLILVVFAVLWAEQYWQKKRVAVANKGLAATIKLKPRKAWLVCLYCSLVFGVAFLLPMVQLLVWCLQNYQQDLDKRYFGFVINTLTLATLTSVLIATLAVVMAWLKRQQKNVTTQMLVTLANLGYAVPGTVLAVGVFLPIATIDNLLIEIGISHGQVLTGSVLVMLLALATRFYAVSFQPIDRQLQRLTFNQQAAAELLCNKPGIRFRKIYLPVLNSGIATALLMGFVEVMKEMPITLMTRRNGWDTLAVRIFEMTSEGMWQRAALPSLLIVLVGLVPVWLLITQSERRV